VSDTAVWFWLHSGSVAKSNNTDTGGLRFKTSIEIDILNLDLPGVKLKALMAGFRKSALISVKIEYG